MLTKDDIESFLVRLSTTGATYTEVQPGFWIVRPSPDSELSIAVNYSPPVVLLRVNVMNLPDDPAQTATLTRRLLELNASDLLHGSYGIQENQIVLTEALELSALDYEEFLATYESMTLALASHLRERGSFRGATGARRPRQAGAAPPRRASLARATVRADLGHAAHRVREAQELASRSERQDRRGEAQEEPPHRPPAPRSGPGAHSADDVLPLREERLRGIRQDGRAHRDQRTADPRRVGNRGGVHRRHAPARLQAARERSREPFGGQSAPRAQAEDGHARSRRHDQQGAGNRPAGGGSARGDRPAGRRQAALMDEGKERARFRFGPILAASVFTVLLVWLTVQVVEVFLLLVLVLLLSLYLGAIVGVLHRRAHIPERLAFILALAITFGGLSLLVWTLVPPLIQQTQDIVKVLPAYIDGWETAIDRLVTRGSSLESLYPPAQHHLLLPGHPPVPPAVTN